MCIVLEAYSISQPTSASIIVLMVARLGPVMDRSMVYGPAVWSFFVNLLTKEVKNEKVSKDILDRDIIRKQMFEKFVTDRLTEENCLCGQTSETETRDIQECECDSRGEIRREASQGERRKRFT